MSSKTASIAQQERAESVPNPRRLFAWAVHAYTASGALAGFAMTMAVFHRNFRAAFLLMVVATMIDASDGVLARLARVKEATPGFDGARLDDIVDYLTFVFVPALLVYEAGLLPRRLGARRRGCDAAEQRLRLFSDRRQDGRSTSSPAFRRTGTSSRCTSTRRSCRRRSTPQSCWC